MYAAIDMKSFYASVECVEKGLDPLTTNLVVADASRTDKTICLAVSPALKNLGVPGRPRLFEVNKIVGDINRDRLRKNNYRAFAGKSRDGVEVQNHPDYELDYHIAVPRMELYEKYSAKIYGIFLKYFSPEDIHIYSCDEAFIYIEPYLRLYNKSPFDLIMAVVRDVLGETGITATAGIGTNMYLCKIAMDIVAKKMPADDDGVRIAELDEISYREKLWEHTPLTDFWGFGKGIVKSLEKLGLRNMADICMMSEQNEDVLYDTFGVRAELIIDHAWGVESCSIRDIHEYEPKSRSLNAGQVLQRPYLYEEAEIILREMVDSLVLKLVDSGMATDQIGLSVIYDCENMNTGYNGKSVLDHYGRNMPKPINCTHKIRYMSSSKEIMSEFLRIFHEYADPELLIRKISISFGGVIPENEVPQEFVQYDLFTDVEAIARENAKKDKEQEREKSLQKALIHIKNKYGKNAVLKGLSLQEGATARERNMQIGGHKA